MSDASSHHTDMPRRTSLAPVMSFKKSKTSQGNTDDEGLVASSSKRQRLKDRTYTKAATANDFFYEDYTIGWICALWKERAAAKAMLDVVHDTLRRAENDSNTYDLGSIAGHNVVIACLPSGYHGNNNAAIVASNMRRTFSSIRLCLMVGIGGGVPGKTDIRLGDVVVGEGVVQHDIGKNVARGSLARTGHVNRPPQELLTAVAKLRADHEIGFSQIPYHISEMLERYPKITQIVPTIASSSDHVDRQRHLLDSLKFDRMDTRRTNIEAKYSTTCQWLLTSSDYVDWLDPNQADNHHGFLWIRGNPGTGKSTIMSFTCKEMVKEKERIVISFFFNARGDGLERSTLGMYRSLLFQVLSALPRLLDVFDEPEHKAYLEEMHTAMLGHQHFEWHIGVLQDLLRHALVKLGQTVLTIFVDALDECAADQVEELVEYFEGVGENVMLKGSQLNICFSSRYYPHLDIQYGRKINLEDQDGHKKDIAMYIQNKLKVGKSKTAEEVKTEIQTKAKGIFMWVVLVVDILKAEYKNGRVFDVKKRLSALPAELGDLFKQILLRDQNNLRDLQLCIRWILFSRRPLKLEEYYFAAVSGLNPGELRAWDPVEVTTDDMSRFVISSSKGLAETTKTKLRTVQFIHESCKSRSTTAMLLLLSRSRHFRLPVSGKYPFLKYATRHILFHADAAAHSASQCDFLDRFPLKAWITVDNLFETHEFRRHTNASLLYILAEKNLARLIEEALRFNPMNGIKGEVNEERYQYPLFVALANGHRDAVRSLLQTEAVRLEDDILARLDYGSDFRVRRGQTPLSWAAAKGHEGFVRLLLETGSAVEEKDLSSAKALVFAAENGHTAIVQLLLAKNRDIGARVSHSSLLLLAAARNGHFAVVKLLLEHGSDLDARHNYLRTPLMQAAEGGHIDIVQLLLENGADVDLEDKNSWTALMFAARGGEEAIVRLLLEKGADIDRGFHKHGMTPLHYVTTLGDEAVVRLLLEKGAAVDAKDSLNQTPLHYAVSSGDEAVVRLLLEKGAAVDAKDDANLTPLRIAAQLADEAVVQLLLERGAAINTEHKIDKTLLVAAASWGNEVIVQLLLEAQLLMRRITRTRRR
ncbi:uncharacterized protein LMH87_007877 [Akanthomyces muscarius]|uniref:Nephrocystin 3-like N-terminal domain-containing protein n=1 Tax=Akanthomyces muscarius TaxID=2231603 RepID=A0A9W8UNE2_AKAMU|nr:uncharacterized protein LMH87_007877 [Akanthomyces muscarius]KAJ4159942.1 hypothetical protein LMH87_007877 [Akanthomyces muscarius]